MTKSKTLLEVIGWDQSDLDSSGTFVQIAVENFEVYFRSSQRKYIQFSQVIKKGDKLKFHKVFQYLFGSPSLNPLRWLGDVTLWVFEYFLMFFSKYKRLNLMEASLASFENPSKDITDFPFDEWLDVIELRSNTMLAGMAKSPLSIFLRNPKDDAIWALDLQVFSHITLIEYEEGGRDHNNDLPSE